MRAVVLREVGGDLALEEDWPEPTGSVVDVRAAGINFADVLIRRGLYPQMPELPVRARQRGRRRARRASGCSRCPVRRAATPNGSRSTRNGRSRCPDNASFAAGASFLTTYLTAYIPLNHQVRVTPASTVLVHAGSGGVGCAAIQLAKQLGAKVIATASSDEKRAFALGVGADEALGYDELDDLRVDVVIDPVGGDVFTRSLPLLNPLGSIVAIGFAGGLWTDPSVQWLVGRNASVVGVYLGRLMKLQPQLVHECAIELLALWARDEIAPVVGATFPLGEAAAAHALIEARKHVGKVVLEP